MESVKKENLTSKAFLLLTSQNSLSLCLDKLLSGLGEKRVESPSRLILFVKSVTVSIKKEVSISADLLSYFWWRLTGSNR